MLAKAVSYSISTVVFGYVISVPLRYYFGCRIVGLTGSIASGKSTCMRVLRQSGGHIDMDIIGKVIQIPGFSGWANLRKTFGFDFFHPDGSVNSDALGRHIFGNREERNKLNSALQWPILKWMLWDLISWFAWHVWVLKTTEREIDPCRVVYLDAALLFEAGLHWICDSTVVISVTEKTQIQRLMSRDQIDEEYAKKKISSQGSSEWKEKKASVVIKNNGDFASETVPDLNSLSNEQLSFAKRDLVQCLIPTRFSFIGATIIAALGCGVYAYYEVMFTFLELAGGALAVVAKYVII